MPSHEILQTISQVAAAFAGFSGVVAALGCLGIAAGAAFMARSHIASATVGQRVFLVLVDLAVGALLLAAAGVLRQYELIFVIGLILALAAAAYNFLLLLAITGGAE